MIGASPQWELALALAFREIGEDFPDIARDAAVEHPGGVLRDREEGPQLTLDTTTHVVCLERNEGARSDRVLELVQGLTAFDPSGDPLGDLLNISAELRQHGLSLLDRPVSRYDAVELQGLERPQGGRPLVGEAISHVGEQTVHQIAGR